MRLVRFIAPGFSEACFGLVEGDRVFTLPAGLFGPYEPLGEDFPLSQVRLTAPCRPSKVVAIGLNYRDHADEFDLDLPESPIMFLKGSHTVIGPEEPIILPAVSRRVDYEAELAVVVGRRARNISAAQAADHILGYTCLNDVTARDLQKIDGQWTRAKNFDTFCPLGPAVETGLDPSDLAVSAWLNGEKKQESTTANLAFGVFELIARISAVMTLFPGDVIASGTPSGVGPMKAGDRVEVRVPEIGVLANPVVGAE